MILEIEYLLYLCQMSLTLKNKMIFHPELCNYQLEDSKLISVQIDDIKHTCSITLKNVLFYNEKRRDKNVAVDGGSIVIKLIDTIKVSVNGELSIAEPDLNTLHQWSMIETEDKLLNFHLLVLVEHRHFLFHALHKDIEVLQLGKDYEPNLIQ